VFSFPERKEKRKVRKICSLIKEDTYLVEDILKMPGPSFL